MRITVDMNKCQDHGQCVFAAPDVFSLDPSGRLAYVSTVDDSLRDGVEDAADVCPLQAITIED